MTAGAVIHERYEVVRQLGSGGAGDLFLVRDRRSEQEPCALKILRPKVKDPGLEPLFRSEFLLLSEVRHESVVRVREFGVLESGEPYFTMDFIPGEDCRSFVREDRLEAAEFLDLARGLLGALAHIHARNILHRDIKPANVIVRRGDDGLSSTLVDFGLAIVSAAARPREAAGTLPYVAPEVLAGAAPDPRSDLFSLGVLLYETASGKPIGSRADLLRSPRTVLAPDRIRRSLKRSSRGTMPRRFEEVVCRLTAPHPAERYASAAEAFDALTALYGDEQGRPGIDVAEPVLRFSEPPLVGRKQVLDGLLNRVDALAEGHLLDPIVVVAGPSGYGVSRLLATLRNHAAVSGCIACAASGLEEMATEIALHPRIGGDLPVAGEDAASLVFRSDAMLHSLGAEDFPVLIFDDLHLFDAAACDALHEWIAALERRSGRARLLLVLGGRCEGRSPGAQLLRTAGRAVPVELRELAPLNQADVRQALVGVLSRPKVPGDAVQALHRASGGNPHLLGELLQLMVAERVLEIEGGEAVLHEERLADLDLPSGLAEVAERRAQRLPDGARAGLARFALVDSPLRYASARVLCGDQLELLVRERFLVVDRGQVRFPNELSRRGADFLPGKRRAQAAKSAAKTLSPIDPEPAARLWTLAGDYERAREVGLPVASDLLEGRRFEEARRLLLRVSEDGGTVECDRLLLRVLQGGGRAEEAVEVGLRIVEEGWDLDAFLQLCAALHQTDRPEDALELLDRFEEGVEGVAAARFANARAALLLDLERMEEALDASRQAEELAGSLFALGGRIARVRANILLTSNRHRAALAIEDRIIASAESSLPSVHSAWFNRSVLLSRSGHLRRSLHAARETLRLSRERGGIAYEANALYRIGTVLLLAGRPLKARRAFERALPIFEQTAREAQLVDALLSLAECSVRLGVPATAEAHLQRAASLPRFEQMPRGRPRHDLVRALLLALGGRHEDACEILRGRLAVLEDEDRLDPFVVIAYAEACGEETEVEEREAIWRQAAVHARHTRRRELLATVRVGLAECAAERGAWRLAERFIELGRSRFLEWKTPMRARALLVGSAAALQRGEPAAAGRLVEEAVQTANRSSDVAIRAKVYAATASVLEEGSMQRFLRQPTAGACAVLLESARDVWALYGNDKMLHKIDLHLSELPRPASDPLGSPDAERLVKILHIAREMNREFDRDRLLGLILDRAIELAGAERGFVILLREGREEVHLARNIDRESISDPERKVSSQIIKEVVRTGRILRSEDAALDQRFDDSLSVRQLRLKSIVAVPFRSGTRTVGALYLDNRFRSGSFDEGEERLLELFADQAVVAIDKANLIRELETRTREAEDLAKRQREQLDLQDRSLGKAQSELRQHRRSHGWGFERIVARSVAMQAVVREAKRFSKSSLAGLVLGENGTGKEVLARAMHFAGPRQETPFVAVNCAAFAEGLLEAELFGYVRGSFTGADRDRPGLFEEADGGTLFLDEVGDMSAPMQVRLLRVLEQGEVKRVGESRTRVVDVRVIAATNADLEELVRNGKFREDLYYRLAGFVLHVPPLRERLEDVEPLAYAFVEEAAQREGRPGLKISNDAIARLESFSWGGNVRELRNVIMRAAVGSEGDSLEPEHISFDQRGQGVLPGFDAGKADRTVEELANQGFDLNRRQQTALMRVLTRGKLEFGEYRDLFRVSKSTTARDLEQLLSNGLLEKRGKTRSVVYLPGAKLKDTAKRVGGN